MKDYQGLFPPELLHLDEASLERELLLRGLEFVIEDPRRYLLLSISRIPDYFKFWPSPDSTLISNITKVTSFGLMLPFMLLGCVMWIRNLRGRRFIKVMQTPGILLLAFSFVYTSIHVLTWTSVRYRLPIDSIMLMFGAYGFARILARLRIMTFIQGVNKFH